MECRRWAGVHFGSGVRVIGSREAGLNRQYAAEPCRWTCHIAHRLVGPAASRSGCESAVLPLLVASYSPVAVVNPAMDIRWVFRVNQAGSVQTAGGLPSRGAADRSDPRRCRSRSGRYKIFQVPRSQWAGACGHAHRYAGRDARVVMVTIISVATGCASGQRFVAQARRR